MFAAVSSGCKWKVYLIQLRLLVRETVGSVPLGDREMDIFVHMPLPWPHCLLKYVMTIITVYNI